MCTDTCSVADAEIKDILDKAEHIRTVEVEKIQAGADADIIFGGTRRYDEDGNILGVGELTDKEQEREDLMAMFEENYDEEDLINTTKSGEPPNSPDSCYK